MIGGDLVERHGEHVVQHEGEALGGVSVSRTTSSASPTESASSASCSGSIAAGAVDDRIGHVGQRLLPRGPPRAQHVQETRATTVVSQPREVLDLAGVGRLSRSQAS